MIEVCIPCKKRQNELGQYLIHLRSSTKQRAINENRAYAIWFDDEDVKYYAGVLSEVRQDPDKSPFEIISEYP